MKIHTTASYLSLALAAAASPVLAQDVEPEQFASGRILVSPRPGLPEAAFKKLLKDHGGNAARKLNGLNVYVVEMPHGREKALKQAMKRNPHVKFAELDGVLQMQQTPSDPYYANEWHQAKIGAPSAWDIATGSGVTIAILDTGVDATHPDLAARIVPGWNTYDNNSNTSDVYGHGTKVAGAAAAAGNNAVGVAGTAWNAKIMPMRISDTNGYITYYSMVANAITWAADRGARVANISYGVQHVASVQSAAQYMRNKGGVVVTAGGNNGALDSNAGTPTMLTVAATDGNDVRASWSTYGAPIDLSAPGVGIWTTVKGGGYGAVNGTSFASPVTAGVVALMLSANPALKAEQIDSILLSTADDLGTAGRDTYYGAGRVNAYRAVLAAKSAVTSDTQAPTVAIASPGSSVKGIANINVSATDNLSVSRVELYVGGALLASDTTAPYSFAWDTSTRADGATTLVAKAYDSSGNVGTHSLNVTVANTAGSADTTPPVVSISNPASGATVSGNVAVSVTASDNVALSNVSLYIDGVLKASGNGAVSYNWNSRKEKSGSHTVQAVARDSAGNTSSKSVQVWK
ncbi:S8 family serine peptidase [Pseudoduganella sp. DS3]|uniref:S8 family serine peptidase n=1 Tax=Pseudoduganella guangdongensis TaxID=2692179 RepID=A0A6N9HJZ5_9BURK|nr:S8 family serine peptidase [Pseudoduganella guangdongensis]MYN03646.1 S8 family serine peptidase [Pseudoduganella guangdongensis]